MKLFCFLLLAFFAACSSKKTLQKSSEKDVIHTYRISLKMSKIDIEKLLNRKLSQGNMRTSIYIGDFDTRNKTIHSQWLHFMAKDQSFYIDMLFQNGLLMQMYYGINYDPSKGKAYRASNEKDISDIMFNDLKMINYSLR